MERRKFVKYSTLLPLLPVSLKIPDPIVDYKLKTSCNLYSFNSYLSSGKMSLEEVISFCGRLGFDAVDPTGYYFTGYPEVPSDEYIYTIKRQAFDQGMAISGTGIRTDFAVPDVYERRKSIELTRKWIDVAAKMDAPVLRIFAGKKIPEGKKKEAMQWIVDSIHKCVDYGSRNGVIITMQNHFDALKTLDDILYVLDAIDSPWFGLNLDIGSVRLNDPYEDIRILMPYARTWQIKEHVYRKEIKEPTAIPKLIALIKDGGYHGYLPLETLRPSDPMERLEPFLTEVKKEIDKDN